MIDLREAAQQALMAMDYMLNNGEWYQAQERADALRAALAQASGEPVAWRYALDASVEGPRWIYIDKDPHQWRTEPAMANAVIEPLHIAPQPAPAQARQPLTGVELTQIELRLRIYCDYDKYDLSLHDFARAIEAAHGIKEQS